MYLFFSVERNSVDVDLIVLVLVPNTSPNINTHTNPSFAYVTHKIKPAKVKSKIISLFKEQNVA
jgi:hypothetical protein